MSYELDLTKAYWRVNFRETLTNLDLQGVLKDAVRLEQPLREVPNRLIDIRNVDAMNIGFQELSNFTARRREQLLPNDVRTAILTNHPVQFGIARMFQTLLDHPQITVRVYQDEELAVEWLME